MTGRPKVWTEGKLNQVKFLMKYNSMSEIGKLFDTTKNAVLGALYRDKVKNGYVPPPDSKYTGRKNLYSERKRNLMKRKK